MPYTKTLLSLANSRKPGGLCVAGKAFAGGSSGAWIRPVSTRRTHEISNAEERYANGQAMQLLDVVTISMTAAQPLGHQTENHVIAAEPWQKVLEGTWDDVVRATDAVAAPLWHDGVHSYHGHNDKVPEAIANTLTGSLLLVNPDELNLVVAFESRFGGGSDRRVRADFSLNGGRYNFVVTDPWIEAKYFALADGRYPIETSRLCVSLPELLNGNATKLVAAVITPDGVAERRR